MFVGEKKLFFFCVFLLFRVSKLSVFFLCILRFLVFVCFSVLCFHFVFAYFVSFLFGFLCYDGLSNPAYPESLIPSRISRGKRESVMILFNEIDRPVSSFLFFGVLFGCSIPFRLSAASQRPSDGAFARLLSGSLCYRLRQRFAIAIGRTARRVTGCFSSTIHRYG